MTNPKVTTIATKVRILRITGLPFPHEPKGMRRCYWIYGSCRVWGFRWYASLDVTLFQTLQSGCRVKINNHLYFVQLTGICRGFAHPSITRAASESIRLPSLINQLSVELFLIFTTLTLHIFHAYQHNPSNMFYFARQLRTERSLEYVVTLEDKDKRSWSGQDCEQGTVRLLALSSSASAHPQIQHELAQQSSPKEVLIYFSQW